MPKFRYLVREVEYTQAFGITPQMNYQESSPDGSSTKYSINTLGVQGWELVSLQPLSPNKYLAVFKMQY